MGTRIVPPETAGQALGYNDLTAEEMEQVVRGLPAFIGLSDDEKRQVLDQVQGEAWGSQPEPLEFAEGSGEERVGIDVPLGEEGVLPADEPAVDPAEVGEPVEIEDTADLAEDPIVPPELDLVEPPVAE
jgi:hypothetical protein